MDFKKLKNIVSESYIVEIGDLKNIIPYEYERKNKYHYVFESNVGFVDVEIEDLSGFGDDIVFISQSQIYKQNYQGQTLYNASFVVDGTDSQSIQTNLKELNKIIKTVTLIVKKFISEEKPFGIFVSGANRDSNKLEPDKVKNTLWLAIATGASNDLTGYRIDRGELNYDGYSFDGFMIYKNKIK